MNRIFRSLLAAFALLVVIQAAEPTPEQLVRDTSRDVLAAIRKDNLSANDKRLRELVEQKALPYFDFTRITALAVGRHWRTATPEQQAALIREFRTLLVRTYSTALMVNKIQDIDVKPVKMDENTTDVTVRTEVLSANAQSVPIDYKMLKVGGSWRVYDVAVEGVSLVTNYRNSFNQTIQKDGIDGLIKALADRNAAQPVKPAIKS